MPPCSKCRSEHAYFLAVEAAFKNWEAMQNAAR